MEQKVFYVKNGIHKAKSIKFDDVSENASVCALEKRHTSKTMHNICTKEFQFIQRALTFITKTEITTLEREVKLDVTISMTI